MKKIIIHPGEILHEEFMKPMRLSIKGLAKRSDIDKEILRAIINGKYSITPLIAEKLSKYFKTSSQLWMNLQKEYDFEILKNKYEIACSVLEDIVYYSIKEMAIVPINYEERIKESIKYNRMKSDAVLDRIYDIDAEIYSRAQHRLDKETLWNKE